MPVYPRVNLSTPNEEHPLAQATVAFAVDRSGSTHGRTLECEMSFIKRVSQLLAADRRSSVRVIPWDNRVDNVVGLQGLEQIIARGGTEPDVILHNPVAKGAILGSSLVCNFMSYLFPPLMCRERILILETSFSSRTHFLCSSVLPN